MMKQALVALAFDLGGVLSGGIALSFFPLLESAPWILLLFPPVLSVRGSIGGILSGKLSTMLHVGEAEPRLRGNTRQFYSLVNAILFLSFADTIGIGALAFLVNLLLGNVVIQHLPFFIVVPPLTCVLAMSVAIPVVLFVGATAFKKGLDPDVILYPAMSTVDDVVVTVCYVVVVNLVLISGVLAYMSLASLLLAVLFLAMLLKHKEIRVFRRTLTEGAPIVALSSFLGVISGIGLASLKERIENHPSILILYPALIDTLGDIGSILGSMETTKLALGYARSSWNALKETMANLLSVETAAAIMHVCFGLVAFFIGKAAGLTPNVVLLVTVALISNLVSFLFVSIFSLVVANQTFKHGLDPDNFVIPLVTSASDLGATMALMGTIAILGIE